MIRQRNYLIFGLIEKIITLVVKTVLKILGLFHLTPMFLVGIVGVVVYFTGAFNNHAVLIIFDVALGLTAGWAVIGTIMGITGHGKKKKAKKQKRGKVDVVRGEMDEADTPELEVPINTTYEVEEEKPKKIKKVKHAEREPETARFYEVRQNPSLVMAEYSDRYELYQKTAGGLIKLRTDYK